MLLIVYASGTPAQSLNVWYSHSFSVFTELIWSTKPWPHGELIILRHFCSRLIYHSDTPRQTLGLCWTEEETTQQQPSPALMFLLFYATIFMLIKYIAVDTQSELEQNF